LIFFLFRPKRQLKTTLIDISEKKKSTAERERSLKLMQIDEMDRTRKALWKKSKNMERYDATENGRKSKNEAKTIHLYTVVVFWRNRQSWNSHSRLPNHLLELFISFS
jgi:hypothetical protein